MADVMRSPPATWVVPTTNSDPAKSLQGNHFPSDTRQNRTLQSTSRETGPVMDHVHQEESGCDNPDGGQLRESDNEEAETLMHWELPGGEQENTETDQEDVKQTETTTDSHHVHDLVEQFESIMEDEADTISSAIQVLQDKSVGDIIGGIGRVIKGAGRAGVKGLENLAHKIRYILPKSHTGKDQGTSSNIHVQHPSHIGHMVGLGMNIHKVNGGHLVQTVAPGGLAHKANIKDNDIIKKVNDNDVENWEFEKLQEFFGNQRSIVIKLVIERQNGVDKNGQSLFVTVTVAIELSFEDDQVVADIDVTYKSWNLSYDDSVKTSDLPEYLIYQEGAHTSKFLSLNKSFCGMTTNMTKNCHFQMYMYQPGHMGPRVLYNMGMSRPLDLGNNSRIGDDKGLTGSGISTDEDKRFFYYQKQPGTNLYVFELIAKPNYFLTVANDGSIKEAYFQGIESVTDDGLFNTVPAPISSKSDPSKAEKLLKK